MTAATDTRAGFVAVVGAPNVGKSTLVNRFVGAKVSIVSPKVQTTRTRVLGICMAGATQLIFVDTPGIFAPRRRLDRAMVAAAWSGAADADAVLVVVDAEAGLDGDTRTIVERLKAAGRKAVLAINKVDAVKKPRLLKLAAEFDRVGIFTDTFMISALTGDGVEDLKRFLAGRLPQGPWLFPEDQICDMPNRLTAAEITREQIYLQLRQELPYAAAVETTDWLEKDDGSVRVEQAIYVEKESQKAIMVGKQGNRIKELGEAARKELEAILGRRVHLFLLVKVKPKWGDDPACYRDLGLDYDA
ncbi:MAG: GTPase Era [Rhodospirillales bacterium]|nr:GTPase Era [Rhodospirillales bacterium]MBI3114126.1 GTPase Era [Rhodospirillales bacterium]